MTLYPIRKVITMPTELAAAISDYRHSNRIPSEMEAYRALLMAGLEAAKQKGADGCSPAPNCDGE